MKVSVWMITYNQEKYIAQALESVLEQKTDFDFEIVIGEDYSTDNTKAILLEYKKKYPDKIKLLLHEKNVGMVKNQNLVFSACIGEYIAMLEGDDYWCDQNKLQIQYEYMKKYPMCDISFHPVLTTDGKELNNYDTKDKVFPIEDVIVGGGYFMATPSLMLKKEMLKNIPSFLENAPAGDFYLQIFGSLKGGGLYIPKIMATYRTQANGSWSQSMRIKPKQIDFVVQSLEMTQNVDEYLGYKYTNFFQRRYQKIALYLAIDYLHISRISSFYETVKNAKRYVKNKNLKFKIILFFYRYPAAILLLSKILLKVKATK